MLQLPILSSVDRSNSQLSAGRDQHQWIDPADWHSFSAGDREHVLLVDGSQVYEVDQRTADVLKNYDRSDPSQPQSLLDDLGLSSARWITEEIPTRVPIRNLSLAVAQKCNLGCTYCYAEGGSFGGAAKNMPLDVALQAVDRLLYEVEPGDAVNLAYLGGEPLVNRDVLRAATAAAQKMAKEKDVRIGFSITTNGTMLAEDDGEFFERYGFAVTISLDGIGDVHDRQRPFQGGRGSYDQIMARVRPLLQRQRQMQVSARVTVTPRNLRLPETLEELVRIGFHSVGFSPMLSSPTGRDQMGADELQLMLHQMIECGRVFERRVLAGERFPFSNMVNAMKEIHQGKHLPYPCGAGGGYFGVSADGDLFACHRFVDDPVGAMGDLDHGVDANRQAAWLASRHVHFQEPCSSCWARYLCGGGCHHEVIHRGRPACEYIRGWLHYCLQAYVRLLEMRPDFFGVGQA